MGRYAIKKKQGTCLNCGEFAEINIEQALCCTCAAYKRRTGQHRPLPSGTEIQKPNPSTFLRKKLTTLGGSVWR